MTAVPAHIGLLWAFLSAWAGPGSEPACTPLDEESFRSATSSARSRLDAEDLDAFLEEQRALEARLPCLSFVPEPEAWATWLVDVAVVAYFRGEDWQSPLATALQIAPDIDRGVGPRHEIATWSPPPAVAPAGPVPRGAELFVDGRPAERLPGPGGLHLVQLRDARGLRSLLLRDAPVPLELLRVAEPPSEKAPAYALGIALVGGYGRYSQVVDAPGDYVGDQRGTLLPAGALAQLWAGRTFTGPVQLQGPSTPAAHAALGWRAGPVFAGLGLAVDTASYRTADDVHHVPLAAPAASLQVWGLGPLQTDLGLVASAWPGSETSVTLRGASTLVRGPSLARARLRGGLTAGWRQQWLVQGEDRKLLASDWQVAAHLGLAWGAW